MSAHLVLPFVLLSVACAHSQAGRDSIDTEAASSANMAEVGEKAAPSAPPSAAAPVKRVSNHASGRVSWDGLPAQSFYMPLFGDEKRILKQRFSSHRALVDKLYKQARDYARTDHKRELQARSENYPLAFHFPKLRSYQSANPAAKSEPSRALPLPDLSQPASNVHGRHLVHGEGTKLVVRELTRKSGEPNMKLPKVSEIDFGPKPHGNPRANVVPRRVLAQVSGDRVVVMVDHKLVILSYLIDDEGQLTKSRSISGNFKDVVVAGDQVLFGMLPVRGFISNPSNTLKDLPSIQVLDWTQQTPTGGRYPLVDGRLVYGDGSSIAVAGRCSWSTPKPADACTATTLASDIVTSGSPSVMSSKGWQVSGPTPDRGERILLVPWNGDSPSEHSARKKPDSRLVARIGNSYAYADNNKLKVLRLGAPTLSQSVPGEISALSALGNHLLIATKEKKGFVLSSQEIGKQLRVVTELAFPGDGHVRGMTFYPLADDPSGGVVLVYLHKQAETLLLRVEDLELSMLATLPAGALPVVVTKTEVVVERGGQLSFLRP